MVKAATGQRKQFTLEDARKQFVLRSYIVTIEKQVSELQASETPSHPTFNAVVGILRSALESLGSIHATALSQSDDDCWDGYVDCNGVCRVWCSS